LDDRDKKPAVLFLHGFLGNGADWRAVTAGLEQQFDCIALDLPGHGSAPPASGLTFEAVAVDVLRQLSARGIARCAVVGYSMGGRLALYLAATRPTRFDRVVLESASPGLKTKGARHQRRENDERLARRLDAMACDDRGAFRTFLKAWYDQPLFASLRGCPERRAQLIERRLDNTPESLAAALRCLSTGAQRSLWKDLSSYTTPTLLIVGEWDRKYRMIAEEMSEQCPTIAVEVFSSCGHNVHFENPGGYTTALRAFLSSGME